jgi:uncharacterized delta-60 repeat protein
VPVFSKTGTDWKPVDPFIKVGSNWKVPREVWQKLGSDWQRTYAFTALEAGFFRNDVGFSGTLFSPISVSSLAIQSNGQILVGGAFNTLNGVTTNSLVRLNADGTVDTTFSTNLGTGFASGGVNSLAIQSDGKILVGGAFFTLNGVTRNRLVRLNADGTVDTAFYSNLGTGFDGQVTSLVVQSDGKILVGGFFTSLNGVTRLFLVRLNANGTEDTAFYTNLGAGFNSIVTSLAIQSNGQILVGGFFTSLNGVTRNRLVRLNSTGTVDTTFSTNLGTGFNSSVRAIAIQSNGQILVGGFFTTLNDVTRNRLVRLNSTGTVDTAFYTNLGTGFANSVNSLAIQSDGKILVGGDFATLNGTTRNRLVRLNSNGTVDTAFYTNLGAGFTSGGVNSLAIQSDGKILAGGVFTSLNGATRVCLARLESTGQDVTPSDLNPVPANAGFNSSVTSLAIQSNGQILAGGAFTVVNGVPRTRLVRLNANGTEDTAFNNNLGIGFNSSINSLAIQSDGKILVGGFFTSLNGVTRNRLVRLNANGTEDTAFYSNLGVGFNSSVFSIIVQSDGKILVGGDFRDLNGQNQHRLVRLNSNGTVDSTFRNNVFGPTFSTNVASVAIQSDGKILVGGAFTLLDNATRNRLVRLNADGTEDTAFYNNLGTGFDNNVFSIIVQSDGKILVGGAFTTLNGATRNRLVRLNSNGTVDTAFYNNLGVGFNSSVTSLAIQSDGKILAGGGFTIVNGVPRTRIVRLNANGTEDTAFYSNLGTGFNGDINSLAIQSNGQILVGGSSNTLNGIPISGGFVRFLPEQYWPN